MQFLDAVKIVFRKYANFRGVATRPEYWWFTLFVFLVGLIGGAFDIAIRQTDNAPVQTIISVALFLPQLTVMVRRNRDAGFSAWWLFLWVLPVVAFFYGLASNVQTLTQLLPDPAHYDRVLTDTKVIEVLAATFLPGLIALFVVGMFFFVVSLLPSKVKPQAPTVATIDY